MKVGRNEPCPCGSGKKHKACCGSAPQPEPPRMLAWRRVRRAIEGLAPKLLGFITEVYGPDAILEGWEEFTLWSEEPFDPESPQTSLFYPWLFHLWSPDPVETTVAERCLHAVPPTQALLISRGHGLDPLLRRYLAACLDSPCGFYELVSIIPGEGMRLREVLTESTYEVLERGTSDLRVGDIVFGTVVECEGIAILEASAPYAFPPRFKPRLIEEREALLEQQAVDLEHARQALEDVEGAEEAVEIGEVDAEQGDARKGKAAAADPDPDPDLDPGPDPDTGGVVLRRGLLMHYEISNREMYWELLDELLDAGSSVMHTPDGEPLSMQRLIFEIDSAPAAFEALKSLSLGSTDEELRAQARQAPDGMLERVDEGTPAGLETTVLGRIEIDGARLTAEVDSSARAKEFKRLIVERLGDGARYRVTERIAH